MKLSINKDIFQKEITKALKFTSNQFSSLPSLSGVFMELKDKKLTIQSTNLNDFYTSTLSVESNDEFKIIFDAKKASEFLSILPSGVLAVAETGSGVILSSGSMQGEFAIFHMDGYPEFPSVKSDKEIVLNEKVVQQLPIVLFSSSKDDSRPVLTGLLLELNDSNLQMVSTDGFRLSIYNNEIGIKADSWNFIASSRFLSELLSLGEGKELKLTYSSEEKIFSCQMGDMILLSRVIEGDFPPYQKVLPVKTTTKIEVDALEFLKNIKAVSIFARDQANIIIFDFNKDSVTIKPKGQKGETSFAKQEIISFEGEVVKIAFNYRYVLDFLSASNAKKIIIELTTPLSPAVFKIDDRQEYLHVIMPLRTEEVE